MFPSEDAKPQKFSLEPPEANAVRENVPKSEANPAGNSSEMVRDTSVLKTLLVHLDPAVAKAVP